MRGGSQRELVPRGPRLVERDQGRSTQVGLRNDLGLPPERFHEIVDYFHAVQRLSDFPKDRDGWTAGWLRVQKERPKAGGLEVIETYFAWLAETTGEDLSTEKDYWSRHRERRRFANFRSRGLPDGSGAVESVVRRVVNLRLEGASICWTEENAEGVLHLRAHAKSGRWDELENTVLSTTCWRPVASPRRSRTHDRLWIIAPGCGSC